MGKGEISKNTVGRASRYDILYRRSPAWLVPDGSSLPYPGDWAGFVVSVRPQGHVWGPGDTAHTKRALVELELRDEQLAAIRSGKLRIDEDGRSLVPVSFDDRWGRLAEVLRANFADPAKAEREQDDETSPDGRRFAELAALNMGMLPRTVTHSGAGLYEVGPGKTYSTIQSALDQLWTDQGAAAFTASQYIRVFADTYDENVIPNSGLVPSVTAGYALIIEGDPSDSRANVILAPTSGTRAIYARTQQILIRHMTVDGTAGITSSTISSGQSGYVDPMLGVRDCIVSATTNQIAVHGAGFSHLVVADCEISTGGTGVYAAGWQYYGITGRVERCTIIRTGSKGGSGVSVEKAVVVQGCVIDGFDQGVYPVGGAYSIAQIVNNTIYDCTYAILFNQSGFRNADIINNIVDACDYAIGVSCWPDEASDTFGGPYTLRNNCLDYTTAFAYDRSDTKTYAQFIAFDRVDASGDLDATDPLLTNPGAGDFSLQADSPCRHAGRGAGVVAGMNGVGFDASHPDMGAWSSGVVDAPGRPSAEVVGVAGAAITVDVDGEAGAEHTAELVRARTGQVVDSSSREDDGTVSLTAPELSARYLVTVSSRNAAGRSLPSAPHEVFVSAGEGPFEEVRIGVVSRLKAHAGLAALLGTDETGAVPVYAAGPGSPRRIPCVAYTLEGVPDTKLSGPGRWLMTLTLDAWGGSPGVNDRIVGFTAEILDRQPFQGTSWTVKRCRCTSDATRWADDGRTEIRRTAWALVVDRGGA